MGADISMFYVLDSLSTVLNYSLLTIAIVSRFFNECLYETDITGLLFR